MQQPQFVYGTAWKEERTASLVRHALDAGFRGFDTANQRKHYHEAGVGEGLRHFSGSREELWLQTKYTFQRGQDHRLPYDPAAPIGDQVQQSFASSLEHLGVDWLDSLVLHGPATGEGLIEADHQAWGAMVDLHQEGKVRHLGVSNVTAEQLQGFVRASPVPLSFVQNRCYAVQDWGAEVRALCQEHGIRYQGFSLLTANRAVWNSPEVAHSADEHGLTPAQVLFLAARSLGILPLTGTSDPQHMAADLQALEQSLPDAVLETVLSLR